MSTIPTPTPPDEHISDVFAKVAALDPCCDRLLGQLAAATNGSDVVCCGTTAIANRLGWEPRTVTEHAEHLRCAGLIEVRRPPYSKVIYVVRLWSWDGYPNDRRYLDGVAW